MIPISLAIKGLFSYQREQTIYFDRLIEGQLFGIFGAVGSGKSSILEAITFALYGETERLHVRDDRNYNMMNLKSDELLIDFIFVNFDEQRYRFMVRGKRHGKRFEKVNTLDRSAYVFRQNQWEPLSSADAEPIIGLSYDNFRRTIIIPQGKFQEFLQLTDKARTDMLKEIFQLEKYEFFQEAVSLDRKNQDQLQHITGKLSAFEEVNEAQVEESGALLLVLEKEVRQLKEDLVEKEQLWKEMEKRKQLFQDWKAAQSRWEQLRAELHQHEQIKQRMVAYEYAERHFRADLFRLEELREGIKKRVEILKDYEGKKRFGDTLYMELQQEFAQAEIRYQQLEELNQRKVDCEIAQQIWQVKGEIAHLVGRMEKGKGFVQQALQTGMTAENRKVELHGLLQEKRKEKPDMTVLTQLKTWFSAATIWRNQLQASREAMHRAEKDVKQAEENIQTLKEGQLASEELLASIEQELASEAERLRHLQVQVKLGDLVEHLHRGEACPLCGSLEHPEIIQLESVEKQLKEIAVRHEELGKQRQEVLDAIRQLAILETRASSLRENYEETKQKFEGDQTSLVAHEKEFHWEGYHPNQEALVDGQLEGYRSLETELERLEEQINEQETLMRKAEKEKTQYEAVMQGILAEERSKAGVLEELMRQLKQMTPSELDALDPSKLTDEIARLEREVTAIDWTYQELLKRLREQQQAMLTLETRLQGVKENLDAEQERVAFVESKLQATLLKSDFSDMNQVLELLAKEQEMQEKKADLEQYFQQLYHARELYEQLSEKTKHEVFNEEELARIDGELKQAQNRFQAKHEQFTVAKANGERLVKQWREKQGLLAQWQGLQKRAELIGTLKNLFKGSGFVSYVSSVYLRQLCDTANKRFYPLTHQQLKLEVTDKNEFQVRDYLNDGKLRLAKTLSGGQIFQASLSLALALAESVQQQNRAKQNFFFLDEGFGSLDKESLATAFDTLKTLRHENRIVGLISHVEELQQEVDVFLRVKNDPLSGSGIQASWELT